MKKLLILSALFAVCMLTGVNHAHAAITFDSSSTVGITLATTSNTSIAVGTGSNELLVANIGGRCNAQSVTLGGIAATQTTSTFATQRISTWYALGFTAGTVNATVTCLTAANYGITLSSWFGVNQSTPINIFIADASGNETPPSSTITTTVANDLLVDVVGWQDFGSGHQNLPSAGQTQIATSSWGGTCSSCEGVYSSYKIVTSTQTYNMGWTTNQAGWVLGITAFQPFIPSSTAVALPDTFFMCAD